MVLKAKDAMVAMQTPIERVRVSKISAGTIPAKLSVYYSRLTQILANSQESGPFVAEKEKLVKEEWIKEGKAKMERLPVETAK